MFVINADTDSVYQLVEASCNILLYSLGQLIKTQQLYDIAVQDICQSFWQKRINKDSNNYYGIFTNFDRRR